MIDKDRWRKPVVPGQVQSIATAAKGESAFITSLIVNKGLRE